MVDIVSRPVSRAPVVAPAVQESIVTMRAAIAAALADDTGLLLSLIDPAPENRLALRYGGLFVSNAEVKDYDPGDLALIFQTA